MTTEVVNYKMIFMPMASNKSLLDESSKHKIRTNAYYFGHWLVRPFILAFIDM